MYLKALEIQGFKSFPDKTVLRFGEDLTAIVGPNGSGKSNISDAIRWVMGEQSAKGLRGAKMEDVIFGGAPGRPQKGFAQVTLVLDNTEKIFPSMEGSEVSVTRRYYRSGESEYYIDRQSVRLRDVTDLFLDTGLGREGYSIIGQGKIDEILSARSGDRREVFEEAAGISRFRHRKEEAERKLERTSGDLVRIDDKIAELELQVVPLRQQAETAKKYLILRDELRLLEISVWLERIEALERDMETLEESARTARAERDGAKAALEELFRQGELLSGETRDKDVEAERLRAEEASLEGERRDREAAVAVLENTIAHREEDIRRAEEGLEEDRSRSGGLAEQARGQEERAEALTARIGELSADLDTDLERARDAAARAGSVREAVEALRAREALASDAASEARAEAAAVSAGMGQIRERRDAAAQDLDQAGRRAEEAARAEEEARRALDAARETARSAANAAEGHRIRVERRQERAASASEARASLTMEHAVLSDRIRFLRDMEREREGFSRAVKTVLRPDSGLRGIHGAVADLMRVDGRCALAVEIALGGAMQDIVVDREEDAKRAIEHLKRRDAGRATFLPLSAVRGEELRDRGVEQEAGFVGVASRLVRYEDTYRNIFYRLLGRTVVVEDLDRGIAIARRYRNAFRIVTLDGQVIDRGGSMTGGSVSRKTGVLSRKAELEGLDAREAVLRERLEEARSAEARAEAELSAARYALETAEGGRRQAEDEILRLEGERERRGTLLSALREQEADLTEEVTGLDARLEADRVREQDAQARADQREAEARDLRRQAEEALAGQSEIVEESGKLSEEIAARREEIASLTAERDAASERAAELRGLAEELSGSREERQAAVEGWRESVRQAREEIAARQEEAGALRERGAALRERLAELDRDRLAIEARRTSQGRAVQEKNAELLDLERAASKLEQKLAGAGMEEKQIVEKLWETYELSRTDASAQRIDLESVPKAEKRIRELRREIDRLGTINLGAIEQFEQVHGRYAYLTGQREDIEKARKDLELILREIVGKMTEIFTEQFALLSRNFQSTFVELFGGGAARLELEDEADPLGCGIEIKAQPPGKSLKTISLLSGGEKAFVAIALYFAILKVHPTPFCVMDEIEAALDEVNVSRYARYIRNLTAKTQFIVITHRRGTMEEADVLYGVTMQEQGVSKILTVDLNKMARELEID